MSTAMYMRMLTKHPQHSTKQVELVSGISQKPVSLHFSGTIFALCCFILVANFCLY